MHQRKLKHHHEENKKHHEKHHREHKEDDVKFSTMVKIITDITTDSSFEMKSTRIELLNEILKNGITNINNSLSIAVSKIKTDIDLSIINICIKNGADPNSYLDVPSLGPAHILVYAYTILSYELFEMLYYLLILLGGNANVPAFKIEEKDFGELDVSRYKKPSIVIESVYEWLVNHDDKNSQLKRTSTDIIAYILSDEFDSHKREILSVYLDQEDLLRGSHHHHHHHYYWSTEMIPYLLCSRNPNWNKIKLPDDLTLEQKSEFLKIAVNSTFSLLVDNMLALGYRPSYTDFAFWIAHYKQIHSIDNEKFLIQECEKIFISLVNIGYQMDMYCIDEIGSINPEFRVKILDAYNVPLWKKVCTQNDEYIPDELRTVSLYLGIPDDSHKNDFCHAIERITMADLQTLAKANRKRNSDTIASKINFLSDYISESYGKCVTCDNFTSFKDNPLDYSEKMLAYYKSTDQKIWCFLSKDFERLLQTGINPSNNEKLPFEFLQQIQGKINVLKHFGIPLSDNRSIEKIVLSLKTPDQPNNNKTDLYINSIKNLLEIRGITEDTIIYQMKISELINRFTRIGVDIKNIIMIYDYDDEQRLINIKSDLSIQMMFNLICVVLYESVKEDPRNFDKFIN